MKYIVYALCVVINIPFLSNPFNLFAAGFVVGFAVAEALNDFMH